MGLRLLGYLETPDRICCGSGVCNGISIYAPDARLVRQTFALLGVGSLVENATSFYHRGRLPAAASV